MDANAEAAAGQPGEAPATGNKAKKDSKEQAPQASGSFPDEAASCVATILNPFAVLAVPVSSTAKGTQSSGLEAINPDSIASASPASRSTVSSEIIGPSLPADRGSSQPLLGIQLNPGTTKGTANVSPPKTDTSPLDPPSALDATATQEPRIEPPVVNHHADPEPAPAEIADLTILTQPNPQSAPKIPAAPQSVAPKQVAASHSPGSLSDQVAAAQHSVLAPESGSAITPPPVTDPIPSAPSGSDGDVRQPAATPQDSTSQSAVATVPASATVLTTLQTTPATGVSPQTAQPEAPAPRESQGAPKSGTSQAPAIETKEAPEAKTKAAPLTPRFSSGPSPASPFKTEAGVQPQASAPNPPESAHRDADSQGTRSASDPSLPHAVQEPVNPPGATGIIRDIHLVDGPKQTEMHIGLRTTAFGSVEVHAVVRDSQVGLAIGSERGDLRHLLSTEFPAIQGRLQRDDLRLDSVKFFDQGLSFNAGLASGGNAKSQQFTYSRAFRSTERAAEMSLDFPPEPEAPPNPAPGLNVRA